VKCLIDGEQSFGCLCRRFATFDDPGKFRAQG
jgi:hypothetical protein